ncbi:GNAT family N-acetyltransferase [Halomonas eurihalina]|uniref:GNAT family N-acetyltransferase n=1 Tax=Halomonas eurihalina TaxID=42566 RepID=A0A5D9DCK8_HALER|nr:GNAT family N-acetyltransferase [Halomonas eurihalina]MDR5859464.1 GNAT family N-acetyltransferase [Halomonas eurihalina]TZG40501.1 GNAT family N-acetyltransferase [Halomonas eurihalina]
MVVQLGRAEPRHLSTVLELVRAFHEEEALALEEEQRIKAVSMLLENDHYGHVFLIYAGDDLVGYLAVCFGFSIEFAGRDASLDELYVIPEARGLGTGREALVRLSETMRDSGIAALHLEVEKSNDRARGLYRDLGFTPRDHYGLMSMPLL